MSGSQTNYEVYLTDDAAASELPIESPVATDRLDFYDSGVWVSRAEGRDFFPYERVRMIREGVSPQASEAESETEPTDEERAESEPEPASSEGGADLEIE